MIALGLLWIMIGAIFALFWYLGNYNRMQEWFWSPWTLIIAGPIGPIIWWYTR